MAFLEWRRLNFFDLHKQVDNGRIAESLKDIIVTAATSGKSHVILGDITGWAHIISRTWEIISYKAYESTLTLAQQLQHDPYLITIGDDETSVNPVLKVWDWSRLDRHGNPTCIRTTRVYPFHMKPTQATALAVHDNKTLLAIGYIDGSVCVYRGDVTRYKSGKHKALIDTSNSPVINISFKDNQYLFVSSKASVGVWTVNGDKLGILDSTGGGPAVITDNDYMVGRPDAVYCYSLEGRGPCYVLDGEKKRLDWFRSYLVITTTENSKNSPSTSADNIETPKSNQLTILDIQNKFIVFSMKFDEIDAILTEWGSFYILTKSKELLYLDEKDLTSKLNLLFKKNLYDIAIRIASKNQYDNDGLMEIYKQYGDHLYAKGDVKSAIEQYVKTIGKLETSYVIRKYLDCRHMEPLIFYLQELHRKNLATKDHTILLMTCFVKLDQFDQQGKLKEFINSRDKTLNVDVDLAIKVCRKASVDDALLLAYNNKRHAWYLSIMIEDKKDYAKAMEYIKNLDFDDANNNMKKYGNLLMQHLPDECTDFLKGLCSNGKTGSSSFIEQYIYLFLRNSEKMVDFLEHAVQNHPDCSTAVYNALLEHNILVWSKMENDQDKLVQEEKILELLKNPQANYDKDQALLLCQMLSFTPGSLYLYEENKLWQLGLKMALNEGGLAAGRALCRRRAPVAPQLWLDLLMHPAPTEYLPEILNVIDNEKLLSPMLTIEYLASTKCNLGDVRKYLTKAFQQETDVLRQEEKLCKKYKAENEENLAQVKKLQKETVIFQNSRCAACHHTLELPSVHFFCQHSYHQHCFDSFCLSLDRCPACNTTVNTPADAPPERLHARLGTDSDPYAVVSEYFGRGLFNKLTVITEVAKATSEIKEGSVVTSPHENGAYRTQVDQRSSSSYGPGAEARLRLGEGESKQVFSTDSKVKHTGIVPVPEGRMRVLENKDNRSYQSSLQANLNRKYIEDVHRSKESSIASNQNISTSLDNSKLASGSKKPSNPTTSSTNPFGDVEDESYDESKNPFADEAIDCDPTNPFAEDDDYDKNLNPFD